MESEWKWKLKKSEMKKNEEWKLNKINEWKLKKMKDIEMQNN